MHVDSGMGNADPLLIKGTSEGWPILISNLKSLLETGEVALEVHPGH